MTQYKYGQIRPRGPYDQIHNFSENSPQLINFDEYDPIKNKLALDAIRTWIYNAIYIVEGITQEQAIIKSLNAFTSIVGSTQDSITIEYKEDPISTRVNVVYEALYRMFVGQHDNER